MGSIVEWDGFISILDVSRVSRISFIEGVEDDGELVTLWLTLKASKVELKGSHIAFEMF